MLVDHSPKQIGFVVVRGGLSPRRLAHWCLPLLALAGASCGSDGALPPHALARRVLAATACCANCCVIDGSCYLQGTAHPNTPCLVCDPAASPLTWTPQPDVPCQDPTGCQTDARCTQQGTCAGTAVADGTPCAVAEACLIDPQCQGGVCEGAPADCSALDTPCATGVCDPEQGVCVAVFAEEGTVCASQSPQCIDGPEGPTLTGDHVCDEMGSCGLAVSNCGLYGRCATHAACLTSCSTHEDCVDGALCVEATCQGQLSLGEPCPSDPWCKSGHCAEGVCCESACDAPCFSCQGVATGEPDGTCAPALAQTNPRHGCTAQAPDSCGQQGWCDGNGACALWPADTPCGPSLCLGPDTRADQLCDGDGTCRPQVVDTCFPGLCTDGRCINVCTEDGDCPTGAWCDPEHGACSHANRAPIADLQGPEWMIANVKVELSAAGSFDPDGDSLTYTYRQVGGPETKLTPKGDTLLVEAPPLTEAVTAVYQVVVSDGELESLPAVHIVRIRLPPSFGEVCGCGSSEPQWLWAILISGGHLWVRRRRRAPQ